MNLNKITKLVAMLCLLLVSGKLFAQVDRAFNAAMSGAMEQSYLDDLKEDRKDVEASYGLAEIYDARGRLDLAEKFYKQTIKIDPKHLDAHYWLAMLYVKKGNLKNAQKYLVKTLTFDLPNDHALKADILNNLGTIAIMQNKPVDAERYWLQSIEVDAKSVTTLDNLGLLYARQGRRSLAEKYWLETIKYDPKHINALYNLGTLYLDLGKRPEARRYYQRVLDIDPNDADALAAIKEMEADTLRFFMNMNGNRSDDHK